MKTTFSLFIIVIALLNMQYADLKAQNANTALSNLVSPTAVNKSLLAASAATMDLGSSTNSWRNLYLDGALYIDGSKLLTNGSGSGSIFAGNLSGGVATGASNTFMGYSSGSSTTTGYGNTFFGSYAGEHNVAGSQNTCIGYLTGGIGALSDLGSNNTYVGAQITSWVAGVTNATGIGYNADVTVSNTVRIGSAINRIGIGKECSSSNILEFSTTTAKLSNGGTWTNASDKRLKENIEALDRNKILEKINQLTIAKWNYKADHSRKYIGPMAQDFFELFGVGDDTTISTIDPAGVALLGVQALSEKMEVLKEQNKDLQEQIDELKHVIAGLALPTDLKSAVTAEDISPLLGANIPNPYESNTIIPFRINGMKSSATIVVTSLATGRVVNAMPVSKEETFISFDAAHLDTGTYLYSLYIDEQLVETRKMQILK